MLTKLRPTIEPSVGVVRVLLVDRTPGETTDIREMLLRDESFRVHAARDAEEARSMLGGGMFDAAVVDFDMWTTREAAFLDAVRQHHPDMAIVLLTSDDQDGETAIEAVKLGANDCVNRRTLAHENRLAACISASVAQSRTARRRDTMVRWLERESLTDHLTGLHNRHAFDDRLREVCDEAKATGRPVSVIIADVAGTGIVNDVHGRDAGDSMIRRAAGALSRSIRGADFAARVGGDDFGVIISDGDIDLGRLVARRMAQTIERLNTGEWDGDIPVTVTFGIASGLNCEASGLYTAAEEQLSQQKSFHPMAPILWLRNSEDGPSVA
jgi:two-component system cell cycle response regulator